MADGWDEQRLGLREVVAHIDAPTLIAFVKLIEVEMLQYPSASPEALALKKFKELLEKVKPEGPQFRAISRRSCLNWNAQPQADRRTGQSGAI